MRGKNIGLRAVAFVAIAALTMGSISGCGDKVQDDMGKEIAPSEDNFTSDEKEAPAAPRDKVSSVTKQDDLDLEEQIFVRKIESPSEDFICGMDASSVLVEENSGVRYYDFDGNEADVFKTLSEAGVNYIRLRVWNDPYDEEGHGYGGGNNDVETAIVLGKRATQYGMKVCIDFHYSDFWADPKRQLCPKAWEGMSVKEKSDALYYYTKEGLTDLINAGVDVGMVQIGNEINYGMSGESSQSNVTALLSAGSKAVREITEELGQEIKILVHYTNIEDMDQVENRVKNLGLAGVDYDMIGLSFYPFWDGDFENMTNVVKMIREKYEKEVVIAETSYCYTSADGDGSGNSVSGTDDIVPGYPATVQGQANILRDTMDAANSAGALGVFYWEGVWIPVGSSSDDNSEIWETYGSGWASSFAGDYDPDDAGLYYGGCSWDNQALFGFTGHPLPVLDAMRQLSGGTQPETTTGSFETQNRVLNPGFENTDRSMWETSSATSHIPYDYQDFVNDAHSGTVAFHFWSEQDMSFRIQQTVYGLELGKYEGSVFSQGGDMTDASMVLYVIADGQYYETSFMNTFWADWQHPVITDIPVVQGSLTIGVKITCGKNSWGTLDDFSVVRITSGR